MKVIKTISKINDSWIGECLDGSTVALVTWLKNDSEVWTAVHIAKWSASNIFKVSLKNRTYPLWHPLGGYIDSHTTKIVCG